ncbi:hypothetical protein EBQ24_03495 [Allofranklinella schreckenbergeri]|uniref:Uncharacterized protein n=1 Tax=Allofranklinella schreckenbergeri TaxID=1076744 RepID=A0A3M6R5L5_9BURK|nr:hypothetical protein [Allofranklinella schreckenbergeri]RMX10681.1 hypothetical protein EBQ24_03495 [Allofranklinella schreckenbergeri]
MMEPLTYTQREALYARLPEHLAATLKASVREEMCRVAKIVMELEDVRAVVAAAEELASGTGYLPKDIRALSLFTSIRRLMPDTSLLDDVGTLVEAAALQMLTGMESASIEGNDA